MTVTGSGRVEKLRSGGHAAGSHGLRREDPPHYLNAPAWVVSPVVKLGVVESFTTPAGPDI
jgi:hypothetical protein